jgi:hypothetical protein
MARAAATVTTAPGGYADASTVVTMNAGNTGDGNEFTLTGKELIIIQNTNAGAQTWTATSVADRLNRTNDVTAESIAAGAIRVFGPIPNEGWRQTDGKFYFAASSTDVKFGIIRLP